MASNHVDKMLFAGPMAEDVFFKVESELVEEDLWEQLKVCTATLFYVLILRHLFNCFHVVREVWVVFEASILKST